MKSIKQNSTGNLVKYLKMNLKELGYTVTNTDVFDASTHASVLDFQSKNLLKQDGIVGVNTWVAIYKKNVKATTSSSKLDRNTNIMFLHPTVRKAVVATYVQLQAENIPFRIFEAYRYPERQNDLYKKGRPTGSIVTYAKAWSSYHQYGLAVDFVLYINNKWSWEDNTVELRNWWKKLHAIGINEGLMPLNFETPHLQLMGTSSNALKAGLYPEKGDDTWANHLNQTITKWTGAPKAPPKVL